MAQLDEQQAAPPSDRETAADPSEGEPAAKAATAPAEQPYASRRAPSAENAAPQAFPESDLGDLAASSPSRPRNAAKPAAKSKGAASDDMLMLDALQGSGAASTAPSPSTSRSDKDKSVSSLERARFARSTEGCAAALPVYEQAVQEYSRSAPQSAVLGTALLELSECQFQLGRESLAHATLKRAAEVAPVAVRARALLDREARPAAEPAGAAEPVAQPAAPPPSKN